MPTPRSRWLLLPLVFVSGMASLAVEFGASRLLAPYFGTSLYVWGVLIGLILIYLSAGYVIGGRLADRHPRDEVLYQITAWAGLWIGVIPLVSYPILLASQQGFKDLSVGLVAGTLLAVVLLFAVPVILLGCVSPFAIRLLLKDVETGGNTAGRVYALSTAGSILGTFLPVFWFIPTLRHAADARGLRTRAGRRSRSPGCGRGAGCTRSFGIAVILAWILLPSGIKPPEVGHAPLREGVRLQLHPGRAGRHDTTELILNEGQAIHSIYDSQSNLTHGYWDYLLVADSFRPAQTTAPVTPRSVAILGLAGGHGGAAVPARVRRPGRHHRGGDRPRDPRRRPAATSTSDDAGAHDVVADARYWLDTQAGHYDVIVLDAYTQPYIPFHLTTREFFQQVESAPQSRRCGAVNVGRTATDYRLVDALASTMAAVYPNVLPDRRSELHEHARLRHDRSPSPSTTSTHNLGLVISAARQRRGGDALDGRQAAGVALSRPGLHRRPRAGRAADRRDHLQLRDREAAGPSCGSEVSAGCRVP